MRKIRVFLLTGLTLLCFSGIAYAEWQIDISEWAKKVNYNYGSMRRGHFATKIECDKARLRVAQEAGDRVLERYSKCVGCDSPKGGIGVSMPFGGIGSSEDFAMQMRIKARRTRNPRAALEAMKNERQQKQSDEHKEQQSGAEFEQGKKEMLAQLKGGSGGEGLSLKGSGEALVLKPGDVPAAGQRKAIEDLRNSAYWALKAAGEASNDSYEAIREHGEYSAQGYPGGDIELPSVPDVPAPVRADPQVRVYTLLIKEANRTTSELKKIDEDLRQVEKKKAELEQKIDLQKTEIKELEQKKADSKKGDEQDYKPEETDKLLADARALLFEAQNQKRKAANDADLLASQRKEKEDNLAKLEQKFEVVNKHPDQAGEILKELEGGKQ
jgi:hypothetical protein